MGDNFTAIPTGALRNAATFNAVFTELDGAIGKNNYAATAAPTVNDDSAAGYAVKSRWADLTNDKFYVCVDATVGAAVWLQIGGVDQDHYADGSHQWIQLSKRAGKMFSKSIPHNSATTAAVITLSAPGTNGVFLISVSGVSTNSQAAGLYVLTHGWSDIQIGVLGTVAKFGVTTFTLTAAVDTGTGKITLTLTQANSSSEAQTVCVAAFPMILSNGVSDSFTIAGT